MSALSIHEPPALVCYVASPAHGAEALNLARLHLRAIAGRRQLRPIPPPFDSLDAPLAAELADHWTEPCEAAFEYLAMKAPESLVHMIDHGLLEAADLTFAAEILGRLKSHDMVRAALLPLLSRKEAVVREGAVYGLANHVDSLVRLNLERLAAEDPSAAVRTAATDALAQG